jgi:hypothetical protein
MNANQILRGFQALNQSVLGDKVTGDIFADWAAASDELKRAATEEKKRQDAHDQSEFAKDVADAQYYKSEDFRRDVIEALVEEGCTELQANGRTRDQFHLFKEAQRLGLM